MNRFLSLSTGIIFLISPLCARDIYVSEKRGNDAASGEKAKPLKTINAAAKVAKPGDEVIVEEGIYREWVNPQRGGKSDKQRIVYKAAEGAKPHIKGSEVVKNWEKVEGSVWKVTLPKAFFKEHNPFKTKIEGDWFSDHGRVHHTGDVYLNEKSLFEKPTLAEVKNPVIHAPAKDKEASKFVWYCESNDENTTIWANFQGADPNKETVELSMRPACFYPTKEGLNYITLSGFEISQAATQWGAPTAEQVGMVATHWNKGWIIENNIIHDTRCSGITLGKERETGHNLWIKSNSRKDGALLYIEVVFNTLRKNWNKDHVGSHIVRNNKIYNCEQTGICGSMGAAYSTIENNHIYNIHVKRQFSGAEISGIKFHAPIDTIIRKNRIHDCGGLGGIWLDWMAQGTFVEGNLLYNNAISDVFMEVNHGPYTFVNNIMLSPFGMDLMSEGGAIAHNLITGHILARPEHSRYTPYHLPHKTDVAGMSIIFGGDDRHYNNIYAPVVSNKDKAKYGLQAYKKPHYPIYTGGNVYANEAQPYEKEQNMLQMGDKKFICELVERGEEVFLKISPLSELPKTQVVTTEMLGKTYYPNAPFEMPDGSPIKVDKDYFGKARSSTNPVPGPFEITGDAVQEIKVW